MIATIVSILAFTVATLSFFIASEKFRLDLYNKRFDIYVRSVKFYQALINYGDENENFSVIRNDFIIASRESQFLFDPDSGIYDLLNRLNSASFMITGQREMPRGLPPDQMIDNQRQFSEALMLWNSSMEPLEAMMAPYLNYHYGLSLRAMVSRLRKKGSGPPTCRK